MIYLIIFIPLCLIWQAIKNAIRGPKPVLAPDVVMRKLTRAKCGCLLWVEAINKFQIHTPCAAHKTLYETDF